MPHNYFNYKALVKNLVAGMTEISNLKLLSDLKNIIELSIEMSDTK